MYLNIYLKRLIKVLTAYFVFSTVSAVASNIGFSEVLDGYPPYIIAQTSSIPNQFSLSSRPQSSQSLQPLNNVSQSTPTTSEIIVMLRSDEKTNWFGEHQISVNGALSKDNRSISAFPVVVQLLEGNSTIYSNTAVTDTNGKFGLTFTSVVEGTLKLTAKLPGLDNQNAPVISIKLTKPLWRQYLGIAIPIAVIVFTFVILWRFQSRYERFLIPLSIGLAALAYFLFYMLSPLDPVSNAAVIAALLAPLAPYIYETMKNRRDVTAGLEQSVGKYRNESITEDVKSMLDIYEETSLHQAAFKARLDNINENKLSKVMYEKANKIGIMGNLPGLRVNQYYYYIDTYNYFLSMKFNRNGRLSDAKVYEDFDRQFRKVKILYSELNTILYVNITYNVGRLQTSYLSFPTVEFPTRFASPLLLDLLKAGILGNVEFSDPTIEMRDGVEFEIQDVYRLEYTGWLHRVQIKTLYDRTNAYELIPLIEKQKLRIYNERSAYAFMKYVRKRFEKIYPKLETEIKELYGIVADLEVPSTIECYFQTVSMNKNSRSNIRLKAKDQYNRRLTYVILTFPSHGKITSIDSSTGEANYTADIGFVGNDSFAFSAYTGLEIGKFAKVTIHIYPTFYMLAR